MVMIRKILLMLAFCIAAPALAGTTPGFESIETIAVPRDPRIRVIDYDPDQIFTVVGHTGYQMTIEFESDEKIETVGVGDSSGWQVTPNGNGTLLFLKPMSVSPITNMTLVTNKRRYNIELSSRNGAKVARDTVTYVLRFRLPAPPQASTVQDENLVTNIPEELWNRNYRFEGSKTLVPEEIFDDGRYTFIRFADSVETPAVFAVSGAEDENLVNTNMRGKYIMVDRVVGQIVLRQGKLLTRLHNEAFTAPELGPAAPKPRPRKKRGFLGIGG
jgi:type IV secretion system protein VirB9